MSVVPRVQTMVRPHFAPLLRSSAIRRLEISVLSALVLAALPILPAVAPSHAHLAMTPAANPPWLDQLNAWRASTATSMLTENATWSAGDVAHSTYMVMSGDVAHSENPSSPYYTAAGNTAAQNSNIFVSSS